MKTIPEMIKAMGGPPVVARKMGDVGYPGITRQRVRGWRELNTITPQCIKGFLKAARKDGIPVTMTGFVDMLSDDMFGDSDQANDP